MNLLNFQLSPFSHSLCPSTAGSSLSSVPFTVFCLELSGSRWFPPLLCSLAIFCLVHPLDLLPLHVCYSVQCLVHLLSVILYVWPISIFVSVYILYCQLSLFFFLMSEHGTLSTEVSPMKSAKVSCLILTTEWNDCAIVGRKTETE